MNPHRFLAGCALSAAFSSYLLAAPPPPAPPVCTSTTVQGSLMNFRYAPRGEVDGFFISAPGGAVEVKFPAHLSSAVTSTVSRGTLTRVTGCGHTGPEGDYHVRAETILNLETGKSVTVGASAPPPAIEFCPITSAEGTLSDYRYAPRGEIDGFFLRTATGVLEVRFPAHLGGSVSAIVVPGSQSRATGCIRTGPSGETHMKAESITNTQSGATVNVTASVPPPPPAPKPRR